MPDKPTRTAVDDLVDGFIDGLIPPHHRLAAAPYLTLEVRKTELREAARLLLARHAEYLNAGDPVPGSVEASVPHKSSEAPEGGIP